MGNLEDLKLAAKEADRCVACGLCVPSCPTYRKTGSEADSPRGRIQLINAVAQGRLTPNAKFSQHIDRCLTCRTCESVCPNGVGYGKLIDAARAIIAPALGWREQAARWVLQRRTSISIAGHLLRLAQITGLRWLLARLPQLKSVDALLPPISAQTQWKMVYPAARPQGEVALFLGCTSSILDTQTLKAGIFVLNRLGYTVHIPQDQCCCGGIARQQGDASGSRDMQAQNARAFEALGDMLILTAVSGCGMGLRDQFGKRVSDISAFIASANWGSVSPEPLATNIHVHDACSLRNVMGQHKPVYEMLSHIPQAKILPLPGNDQCCGGAGSYMLSQPDLAQQLQSDKIEACKDMGTTLLVTSNIGCALHIAAGLRDHGIVMEVIHPVRLLARQLGFTESKA